jgi:hypothetical protein
MYNTSRQMSLITVIRGFSSRISRPVVSASMRSFNRCRCHPPVVSPTAATKSARAGLGASKHEEIYCVQSDCVQRVNSMAIVAGTHIYAHMHPSIHTKTHTYTYTYTRTRTRIRSCTCECTCTPTRIRSCTCTRTCTRIRTHIHISSRT